MSFFGGLAAKPPANPRNWPNSTEEEVAANPQRKILVASPQDFSFCNNFVKTYKYEVWNFLPMFLLESFDPRTKVANCFFLAIACLQTVPAISNTNGAPTTLLPLTLVLLFSGILQIAEDIARHRADATANASIAQKFDIVSNEFVEVAWKDIQVGDFINIKSRGQIPADVLILSVHEKTDPPQVILSLRFKSDRPDESNNGKQWILSKVIIMKLRR